MKKVLVALDNHSNYNLVSGKGSELARALAASIVLLHVFPDTITTSPNAFSGLYPMMGIIDIEQGLKLAEQLDKESKRFLNQVKDEINDKEAEIYTGEGDIANVILETAANCKVDIIVMGSHSRSGIDKILMGNVAKQVLKHSHLPLFIVPVK
ncbi:MAG: universal stress protein [Chitinophagaceae bacterium]|jgi:nucleotide-binding universal stress UspA family protein|nr:universal stress protein [Chitinophagaceae bacterium]